MKGVNMSNISRGSNHDIGDKLNTWCMDQVPEKNYARGVCFFVEPDFETCFVPIAFVLIPNWLTGKAFCKAPKHTEQCKAHNGEKTLSAINFLMLTLPDVERCLFQGCELCCSFQNLKF